MEILGLQIFVSLMLVLGSVLLFAYSAKQRDHEQGDRLALLPLENDTHPSPMSAPLSDSDARAPSGAAGGGPRK